MQLCFLPLFGGNVLGNSEKHKVFFGFLPKTIDKTCTNSYTVYIVSFFFSLTGQVACPLY